MFVDGMTKCVQLVRSCIFVGAVCISLAFVCSRAFEVRAIDSWCICERECECASLRCVEVATSGL